MSEAAPERFGAVDYTFPTADASHSCNYLWSILVEELGQHFASQEADSKRVFDLGCGNGAFLAEMHDKGFEVSGVDPSETGVEYGRNRPQQMTVSQGSAYDDLAQTWGQFPAVVSLEVVEHVYAPRTYAKTAFDLVEPGGLAMITTPYHGYIKNVVLAVSGHMDKHFTALWDHGHIKFWSVNTLTTLLTEAGFRDIRFRYAGRMYPLSKSMIAIARKPSA